MGQGRAWRAETAWPIENSPTGTVGRSPTAPPCKQKTTSWPSWCGGSLAAAALSPSTETDEDGDVMVMHKYGNKNEQFHGTCISLQQQ